MMEIINGNVSSNKSNDIKKTKETSTNKKISSKDNMKQPSEIIQKTNQHITEIASRIQKRITREQAVLAGLENVKSYCTSRHYNGSDEEYAEEVIEKTRFGNEKVLEEHRDTLTKAIIDHDNALLNNLIGKTEQKIGYLSEELEKNRITRQNLQSLKSFSDINNPEQLIKKVIASIKNEGVPEFSIPRQRIAELLED
jgi:hypothetical protein